MNGAASYILTVVSAAVVASILLTLSGQGQMGALVRLLAGIFMAITLVSPLMKLEMPDLEKWFSNFSADGRAAASRGEEMANEAQRTIIKAQLEAYILDKAAGYGAELTVDVSVDEAGIPVSVTLTGDVSPFAKTGLKQMLESDLGLGEEVQRWIS